MPRCSAQANYEASLANRVRREVEWLRRGPKARTTKAKSRIDSAGRLIEELNSADARKDQGTAGINFTCIGTQVETVGRGHATLQIARRAADREGSRSPARTGTAAWVAGSEWKRKEHASEADSRAHSSRTQAPSPARTSCAWSRSSSTANHWTKPPRSVEPSPRTATRSSIKTVRCISSPGRNGFSSGRSSWISRSPASPEANRRVSSSHG